MSDLLEAFLDSWPLFGTSYATGWLIAAVLGLCGVIVVAQRQVFLGIATAQASSLGIATALWLAQSEVFVDHHDLHGPPLYFGVGFAIAASLLTTRGGRPTESAESVGAWIFVVSSSLAVILLAHSPHGLEEVERLTFSTLIGADAHDLWKFGLLLALAAGAVAWQHPQFLLVTTDPATAEALGLRVRATTTALAIGVGLAIGMAMHSAGTLYTFGCLALPALAAKNLCRTMRGLFVLAPALAVACAVVGFVLANGYDYPPGQVAVAVQGALLLAAWLVRRLRHG